MARTARRQFGYVWGASTLSNLGSEIGELALPVLALVTLGASATEFSWIRAALLLPYLLLTLALGVLVDRHPRKPLLVAADLGRGGLLVVVCVLALTDRLSVPLLVAAAGLLGSLTVLAMLADFSLLPSVVAEDRLAEANARLTATQSAIGIAGSGAGGALVQAVTAPIAVAVNAVGYLASAVLISRVRVTEPRPERSRRGAGLREALEGVRAVRRHPVLRALVGEAGIWNLANEVFMLAFTVLLLTTYDVGATVFGLILMAGGLGAFLGAGASARLTRRFGYGRSLIAALVFGNTAPLVGMLVVRGSSGTAMVGYAIAFGVSGIGIGVANSQAVTIRQIAVAADLRGRANAAYRLVSSGALATGAVGGGVLVAQLGPWSAAVVGTAGMALASLPVILSPVRRIRALEEARPNPTGDSESSPARAG